MATAIVGDRTVSLAGEKESLILPIVRAQWPSVAENDGLSCLGSQVFVVDLSAIVGGDVGHFERPAELLLVGQEMFNVKGNKQFEDWYDLALHFLYISSRARMHGSG